MFFFKLHGNLFEGFIRNTRTDRYNIMFSIFAHEKKHQSSCDDGSIGGGCSLPSNSTIEALDSLSATIDFIDFWLEALEHNSIERCNFYAFYMEKNSENPC